jgi:hypothetical protein
MVLQDLVDRQVGPVIGFIEFFFCGLFLLGTFFALFHGAFVFLDRVSHRLLQLYPPGFELHDFGACLFDVIVLSLPLLAGGLHLRAVSFFLLGLSLAALAVLQAGFDHLFRMEDTLRAFQRTIEQTDTISWHKTHDGFVVRSWLFHVSCCLTGVWNSGEGGEFVNWLMDSESFREKIELERSEKIELERSEHIELKLEPGCQTACIDTLDGLMESFIQLHLTRKAVQFRI